MACSEWMGSCGCQGLGFEDPVRYLVGIEAARDGFHGAPPTTWFHAGIGPQERLNPPQDDGRSSHRKGQIHLHIRKVNSFLGAHAAFVTAQAGAIGTFAALRGMDGMRVVIGRESCMCRCEC